MQIVTANRLRDGRVVFRDATGGWVEAIADAALLAPDAAATAVVMSAADVAARRIVEPYAIDVVTTPEGVAPKTTRERIRAGGPTSGSEALALAGHTAA